MTGQFAHPPRRESRIALIYSPRVRAESRMHPN